MPVSSTNTPVPIGWSSARLPAAPATSTPATAAHTGPPQRGSPMRPARDVQTGREGALRAGHRLLPGWRHAELRERGRGDKEIVIDNERSFCWREGETEAISVFCMSCYVMIAF